MMQKRIVSLILLVMLLADPLARAALAAPSPSAHAQAPVSLTVTVDTKATFLTTYPGDGAAEPPVVDLAAAGFAPGDQLLFTYRIPAPGYGYGGCGGPFFDAEQTVVGGVFSGSSTLLAQTERYRVPNAIDAGYPLNNNFNEIPQDFRIYPPGGFTIQVPPDATHLFLGNYDSVWGDNCGTIYVTIQKVAPRTWNLSSDFRVSPNQENPSRDSYGNPGVWQYLESSSLATDPGTYSPIALYDPHDQAQGLEGYKGSYTFFGMWYGEERAPQILINATNAPIDNISGTWLPGAIVLHPAPSQYSIVGWRSPFDGQISISGQFTDIDANCGDGVDWAVDQGTVSLGQATIANGGAPQPFSFNASVSQGNLVYFRVGPRGDFGCDSTQLDLTIRQVAGSALPPVNTDSTPPVTSADAPAAWQRADFTVALDCGDGMDGSGCKQTDYRLDGADWQTGNTVAVATGGDHLLEYRSTDNAGNQEEVRSVHVRLDKTLPTISAGATVNGQPYTPGAPTDRAVVVQFTCADNAGGSGIAACPDPVTVSTEGANQEASGTATDNAGNSATVTFSGINIHRTSLTGSVVAWGDNSDGETDIPAGLTGVTAVAAGYNHSLALKRDGTLVAWGFNRDGLSNVPAGLSGVIAVATGESHSLALKSDGTVVGWGLNWAGQTSVPAGLTGVTAIAAGIYHSLALKGDGTVVAWGYNFYGQAAVPAGLSGVTAIAAGASHSLALKSDGTVVAWGSNSGGQATVPAGLSGVTAIAAGTSHSLALKSDGTVIAWGYNRYGQTNVPAGLTGVIAVSAGESHSLALKSDGTVVAWGDNSRGQASVPAGLSGVTAVAAGIYHNLAVIGSADSTLSISAAFDGPQGSNGWYIGDVSVSWSVSDPVSGIASSSGCGVTTFADDRPGAFLICSAINGAGMSNSAAVHVKMDKTPPAISASATVSGQPYTPGTPTNQAVVVRFTCTDNAGGSGIAACPGPVTVAGEGVGQAVSGTATDKVGNSAAATFSGINIDRTGLTGSVVAWGRNDDGQTNVPIGLAGVTAIAAGIHHSVALKSDGTVVAWGYNSYGQATVPAGLGGVRGIAAGYAHNLALKNDGTVVAWGYNSYGQATVPTGLSGVMAVAAGYNHSLALRGDGTVVAWGFNGYGQTNVPAGLSGVTAIAAGSFHSLALKSDGTVVAWGDNSNSQTNVPAGLSGVIAVAAGYWHSLALKSDGTVMAWGDYRYGQAVPAGLSGVKAVAAGNAYNLALKNDGTVVAWGDNGSGQATVPAGLTGVTAVAARFGHSLALIGSVDATPPAITPTLVGTQGSNGWYTGDVMVNWNVSDAETGIASSTGCDATTLAGDTPGATLTCSATNGAGVSNSASVTVKIDKEAPAVTPARSPDANANGWNNTPVTVSFQCSDTGPAGVVTCPEAVTLHEGNNQSASGTAEDAAGNSASASLGIINVDLTPPTLLGAATAEPNANSWYAGDVNVHWTATDGLSGVDPATVPPDGTITGEGQDLGASATVKDLAGNSVSAEVGGIKIDRTPPLTKINAPDGWNKQSVPVILQPGDALSGVTQTYYRLDGAEPQVGRDLTVGGEGIHTLEYWSVDGAGNEETHHTAQVKIDLTAPAISHSQSPAANEAGWNNSDVTVTFLCGDNLSGVASCTSPQTVNTEGRDQQVTGTATDNAGNTATDPASVSLDLTPPTISAAPDRQPNAAGWYNADVTVRFSCADNLSGAAGCPGPQTFGEGQGQSAAGSVADAAGNSASANLDNINVDKTAPTLSGAATAAPNANGWYKADVTVGWSCGDNLSGVSACPADSTLQGEGAALSTEAGVSDLAGNQAQGSVMGLRIDRTPPTISAAADRAPNAGGWYNADVRVIFTCADALSGLATPADPVTVDQEGTNVSATGACTDQAGNSASAELKDLKIDKTLPAISVLATVNGQPYTPGDWTNQDVTVHFTCADVLSGVAQCPGDFVLATDAKGLEVPGTVTDRAGNSARAGFSGVNIDKTPPATTATQAETGAAQVTLSLAAADEGSGVAATYYKVGSGPEQPGARVVLDGAGVYQVAFWSVDRVGNAEAPRTVEVTVNNPYPILTGITPSYTQAGGTQAVTLVATGSAFVRDSIVRWQAPGSQAPADLTTTYVSATELHAQLPAEPLTAGTGEARVYTPGPGGGMSAGLAFFVTQTQATVSDTGNGTSSDPGGTATAAAGGALGATGSVAATAGGAGTVVVAKYDGNPTRTAFTAAGAYFDVYVASESQFSTLAVVACNLNGRAKVRWFDGQSWQAVSPQTFDAATGCVTMQLNNTDSVPKIAQLTGSIFAGEDVPPAVGAVTLTPGDLLPVGKATVQLASGFTSAAGGWAGPYDVDVDWGDGSQGATSTLAQPGAISAGHAYGAAGVYEVEVTVTDKNGGVGSAAYDYVVVYDPNGSFVTGGGWINSPAGAYSTNPALTGKASFGFVSKYQKGATAPGGDTQFLFGVADLNFASTAYDWLVVSGARAQYKGTGAINGAGSYGFLLTAIDGQVSGGGGTDKFRIKIWDKTTDAIVYDNQAGASDSANPTTTLGAGSIVIHK